MFFKVCSQDPVAYRTLPYLDRPNLLSLRLVNSVFRDTVDLLIQDTRSWMDDPIAPRGGVLVRRAMQTVPRSLNDMEYVFRIFQRAFLIVKPVHQELRPSSTLNSLGISLETAEQQPNQIRFMCMDELHANLSRDVRLARSFDLIKDCLSYEDACSVLIRDAKAHPTALDCLEVLHMVQKRAVRQLEPSKQVMDDLVGYWLSLSPPRPPCRLFQDFFVELAQFDHAPYLDGLMNSSRKDELWEVLYEALEAAKKNDQSDSEDLLSSYIQEKTHKSHLIGWAAIEISLLSRMFSVSTSKRGMPLHLLGLVFPVVLGCMKDRYLTLRGMTHGIRVRRGGPGPITFFCPNWGKIALLKVVENLAPFAIEKIITSRQPLKPSSLRIVANLGLGALIYGALSACKMPRASRTLVGRGIYPIAAGVHGLIHCVVNGRGLGSKEKIGPAALGALLSAGYFYLSRATLFL